MGMSTHVVAFKPADDKWMNMKRAYEACIDAGVPIPREVNRFFEYGSPEECGVEINEKTLKECGAVIEYSKNESSGYEIDIKKLPPDVTIVRVYNSY